MKFSIDGCNVAALDFSGNQNHFNGCVIAYIRIYYDKPVLFDHI